MAESLQVWKAAALTRLPREERRKRERYSAILLGNACGFESASLARAERGSEGWDEHRENPVAGDAHAHALRAAFGRRSSSHANIARRCVFWH